MGSQSANSPQFEFDFGLLGLRLGLDREFGHRLVKYGYFQLHFDFTPKFQQEF